MPDDWQRHAPRAPYDGKSDDWHHGYRQGYLDHGYEMQVNRKYNVPQEPGAPDELRLSGREWTSVDELIRSARNNPNVKYRIVFALTDTGYRFGVRKVLS